MSKAKEEAERIVEMFDDSAYDTVELYGSDSYKIGLHAALKHVEGIIKEYDISRMVNVDRLKFMQEVKQELNKML